MTKDSGQTTNTAQHNVVLSLVLVRLDNLIEPKLVFIGAR
jgi:hypothetical protein